MVLVVVPVRYQRDYLLISVAVRMLAAVAAVAVRKLAAVAAVAARMFVAVEDDTVVGAVAVGGGGVSYTAMMTTPTTTWKVMSNSDTDACWKTW